MELGDLDTQTRLSRALAAPQTMHHRPNAKALMDAASTQVYDTLKTNASATKIFACSAKHDRCTKPAVP